MNKAIREQPASNMGIVSIKKVFKTLYYIPIRIKNKATIGAIGDYSLIEKPIRIIGGKHIRIGNRTNILAGLRMEAISEWNRVKYEPAISIGDDVNIGQNCHITCANRIHIGDGVSIMPDVLITDIEHEYKENTTLLQSGLDVGHVYIGDYTVIGMGVRILGSNGVSIGKNVIIGTNTVVKKDVPSNCIVYGNPMKVTRRDTIG